MAASTSLPHRQVVQARALLWAREGVANDEIARRCGVDSDTVRRWRSRFAREGHRGCRQDREGSGPQALAAGGHGGGGGAADAQGAAGGRVDALVDPHDGGPGRASARTRWPRSGPITTSSRGRSTTFKVSNDPRFEEKLVDVVGLYLNPPARAVVFSFDEKTQCQALDRTQPSLPMKPGRAGTMTHDYKRNGTIDLFAAMNVATGEVLTDLPQGPHRRRRAAVLQADRRHRCRADWACTSCWTTCPRTRPRRSRSGWPTRTVAAGTCTSPRPRVPG